MTTTTIETYRVLVRELDERLRVAAHGSRLAVDDLEQGNRNRAIGALIPVQDDINVVASILATLLSLHRARHVGEGGVR